MHFNTTKCLEVLIDHRRLEVFDSAVTFPKTVLSPAPSILQKLSGSLLYYLAGIQCKKLSTFLYNNENKNEYCMLLNFIFTEASSNISQNVDGNVLFMIISYLRSMKPYTPSNEYFKRYDGRDDGELELHLQKRRRMLHG